MNKEELILKSLESLRDSYPGAKKMFLEGGCYRLYHILKAIFPKAKAYYDSNHVITKIDSKYYDITGEVKKEKHLEVDIFYGHNHLKEEFGHACNKLES